MLLRWVTGSQANPLKTRDYPLATIYPILLSSLETSDLYVHEELWQNALPVVSSDV